MWSPSVERERIFGFVKNERENEKRKVAVNVEGYVERSITLFRLKKMRAQFLIWDQYAMFYDAIFLVDLTSSVKNLK